MKNSKIFISYTHHSMIWVDDFNNTLSNEYKIHFKGKHISAYTDGGEIWMQIFADFDLKSAIIGGLIYDFTKSGVKSIFSALYHGIDRLVDENKGNANIDFQRIQIEFNDATITINGLKSNYTSTLMEIFKLLVKSFPRIESRQIGTITEIVIPMIFDMEQKNKYRQINWSDELTKTDFLSFWQINVLNGVEWYIYNATEDSIVSSVYADYKDKK